MRHLVLGAVCVWALQVAGAAQAGAARGLAPLVKLLSASDDADLHLDVLRGMVEALRGRRQVKQPDGWPAVSRKLAASPNAEVRHKALLLSVMFGDPQAAASLRKTASDPAMDE